MTAIFWHRRDLRFHDNAGLHQALSSKHPVKPIFIFDTAILGKLRSKDDTRVTFIYSRLQKMKEEYQKLGSDLDVYYGKPVEIIKEILETQKVSSLYTNHDYEPQAIDRDAQVEELCRSKGVEFKSYKDQVIFEKGEVLTDSKKPYTVFTPYKKKWLHLLSEPYLEEYKNEKLKKNLIQTKSPSRLIGLDAMGFQDNRGFKFFPSAKVAPTLLRSYKSSRDLPFEAGTSHLGLHLRFGTLSIRDLVKKALTESETWLSQLIWREFFMQILFHYPHVEKSSFRPEYENIKWRKNSSDFKRWTEGTTGYPLVDAGMRELNTTGFMHNRVRMVVASFLCKHLLIHWLEGERYFASQLLDFDLAANNGNWQWAAGTGCDAAPYFRIFNPEAQQKRFDPESKYIKKWVPEFESKDYPKPMVDHRFARERALAEFKKGLKKD
jgi:deoxyribodipyrimidine photo-lyase